MSCAVVVKCLGPGAHGREVRERRRPSVCSLLPKTCRPNNSKPSICDRAAHSEDVHEKRLRGTSRRVMVVEEDTVGFVSSSMGEGTSESPNVSHS